MTAPTPDLAAAIKDAPENDQVAIAKLAKLTPMEYDRVRAGEAEKLECRTATLDKEVSKARGSDATTGQGQPLRLVEPEPWPEAVDGEAVLDEAAATAARFLDLPPGGATALALWAAHTHIFDIFDETPRLAFVSPQPRCGKTTALRVLTQLTNRPLMAGAITAAAVARTVEVAKPTLIIDEADALFATPNDDLRAVLNTGHARDGNCVKLISRGDDFEPRTFSTFAPAALASIGRLPNTIMDRSIIIVMHRRRPDVKVERCGRRTLQGLADTVRRLARFAHDNRLRLAAAEPDMPAELHDRAMDNWRPLFAMADAAGGKWADKARRAARTLSGEDLAGDDSAGIQLLADIYEIFDRTGGDRISSEALIAELVKMEGHPWLEWRRGNQITKTQLARQLRYFGISPNVIRIDGKTLRGYLLEQFSDIFARYGPFQGVTPSQPIASKAFEPIPKRNTDTDVTFSKSPEAAVDNGCNTVTGQNGGAGGEEPFNPEDDPEERAAIQQFDGEEGRPF